MTDTITTIIQKQRDWQVRLVNQSQLSEFSNEDLNKFLAFGEVFHDLIYRSETYAVQYLRKRGDLLLFIIIVDSHPLEQRKESMDAWIPQKTPVCRRTNE
eukprot:PhF_6_TR40024/c0_g1_i2/m.59395